MSTQDTTLPQIEALAHRIAWRYKKSTDPHHSDTYTFNRETLHQFAAAIAAQAQPETERLREELKLCCELKREYQERAAQAITDLECPPDPDTVDRALAQEAQQAQGVPASPRTEFVLAELKSALNAMLTFFGMDEDESNKEVFDKGRQAYDYAQIVMRPLEPWEREILRMFRECVGRWHEKAIAKGFDGVEAMCDLAAPQAAPAPESDRNDPVSALAIRLLVAAGYTSQEAANEAFHTACNCLEDEARKMNVSLPWVMRPPQAAPAPAPQIEPARRMSPFDAVAEAMRLASLMGGSIGMSDVEKTQHYEQRLRSHLVEFIYAPPAPQALTDEQLRKIHHEDEFGLFCDFDEFEQIARAVEQAHGIGTKGGE